MAVSDRLGRPCATQHNVFRQNFTQKDIAKVCKILDSQTRIPENKDFDLLIRCQRDQYVVGETDVRASSWKLTVTAKNIGFHSEAA